MGFARGRYDSSGNFHVWSKYTGCTKKPGRFLILFKIYIYIYTVQYVFGLESIGHLYYDL